MRLCDCADSALQNRQKTAWNMYQLLREDPRRRFTLAYSIENTTTRIWFCNRSEMLVSEPFNFVTVCGRYLSARHVALLTEPCRRIEHVSSVSC